ncbi:hypothetical protein D3C87_1658810 [compost metagenome]
MAATRTRSSSGPPLASEQPGLSHRHIHRAVCQRGTQGITGLGLSDAGHRLARGVGQQGIAPLQHQARVQQLQPQRGAVQPVRLAYEVSLQFLRQIGLQRLL